MICLVCGKDFDRDDFCPRCRFPVTFYTEDSPEIQTLEQARADRYSEKLLESIQISIDRYEYGFAGETLQLLRTTPQVLGTGKGLLDTIWYDQPVTNRNHRSLPCRVLYTLRGKPGVCEATLQAQSQEPNLYFGIRLDRDWSLHLLVRDSTGVLDDRKFPLMNE